ncbi:MAG: hypothetical protein ABJM29_10130 [Rhizobiaceae bacterium]
MTTRAFGARHVGVFAVLSCYTAALYFLVPTFNPDILQPGIGNLASYATITYVMGACSAYFSRIFYVSNVGFRFELIAGLVVVVACFLLIGPPLAPTIAAG